jgi:hypothetical protein
MRPVARLVLAAVVMAAGPVLSACDSLDSIELFDSKKKLTGERKPVFPDGVPGVSSGVPPELVRGYREPEGGLTDPARAAAAAAAGTTGTGDKPKPQRTASKPKPKPPSDSDQSAAPDQRSVQGAPAPWPSQQQPQPQAPWPGSR